MSMQQQIERKLLEAYEPVHLDVVDETHQHNVPDGAQSHFKVVIVASAFGGMTRIARHKAVYKTLAVEMASTIHALSVLAYTAAEWADQGHSLPASPPCMGGSLHDKQA